MKTAYPLPSSGRARPLGPPRRPPVRLHPSAPQVSGLRSHPSSSDLQVSGFKFQPSLVLLLVIALILTLAPYLSAQPAPSTEPPPQPARLRFLFLDETPGHYALKLPAPPATPGSPSSPETYRQVSANPYEISAPFFPADLSRLEIYKVSPTRTDPLTGQPLRLKIATLSPPSGTPSALVIVTPRPPAAPDAPLDFRVEIIDCDPADFPPASIRIVNRGRVPLAAQFGAERILAAPGETRVARPATDSRHRVLSKIAAQESSGWQLLSDNITILRPPQRVFGIFVYSPGGMRHTRTPEELATMGPPPPGHFWLTFSDTP